MSFTIQAIKELRPNAKWALRNNKLEWFDENQTQPTQEEIDVKVAELEAQAQLEATQKEFDEALLTHLDTQCATLGFNGDSSTRPYRAIANYVGYDNVFRVDAEKLGAWIADTFAMAEQIEADIMSGARPLSTVDEFLAELPKYI